MNLIPVINRRLAYFEFRHPRNLTANSLRYRFRGRILYSTPGYFSSYLYSFVMSGTGGISSRLGVSRGFEEDLDHAATSSECDGGTGATPLAEGYISSSADHCGFDSAQTCERAAAGQCCGTGGPGCERACAWQKSATLGGGFGTTQTIAANSTVVKLASQSAACSEVAVATSPSARSAPLSPLGAGTSAEYAAAKPPREGITSGGAGEAVPSASMRQDAAEAALRPAYPPACAGCSARWRTESSSAPLIESADASSSAGPAAACLRGRRSSVAAGSASKPTYTICDVRAHAGRDSLWFTAYGRVYDATALLPQHPGGARSLLRHGGGDVEKDFEFHSADAQAQWSQYEIGRLGPCEARPSAGGSRCIIM